MLLLTPESRRWRRLTLGALVLLAASYLWHARRETPHGGSTMGLAYGILAAALLLVLLFLGVRKRWHTSRLGRLESWCQSHVYLGLLMVAVVLCHSGFRFQDRVAVAAFLVLAAVAASGVVGAVLYTVVPLLLTGVETNLAPEEVSRQLNQLGGAMARLAGGRSPALREIARGLLGEDLPGRLAGWRLLLRPPRAAAGGEPGQGKWSRWLPEVPPAEQQELQQLLILARQRRELHQALVRQQRYRNLLALWLYLHVPLSITLLLALAAHLWGAWRYAL